MKIGIGTTGMCNLNCSHCYSRKFNNKTINLTDIKGILDSTTIESVNFGTGENILNPDFREILQIFDDRKIKMSLTTNGYTVLQLEDKYLSMFNDIDFSLEFPDEERQDAYRGQGSWDTVIKGLNKCKSLGIETSIACAMMKNNADSIIGFREIMKKFSSSLRINIIKYGNSLGINKSSYALSYDTFWRVFEELFNNHILISCSEPILCVALSHDSGIKGSPCGHDSMRIQPDGSVLPCVYWPESSINIRDKQFNPLNVDKSTEFKNVKQIPLFCLKCRYVDICKGGCAARRILVTGIDKPDEYCPLVYGLDMPKLKAKYSKKHHDLVHSTYLCTVIFGLEE